MDKNALESVTDGYAGMAAGSWTYLLDFLNILSAHGACWTEMAQG